MAGRIGSLSWDCHSFSKLPIVFVSQEDELHPERPEKLRAFAGDKVRQAQNSVQLLWDVVLNKPIEHATSSAPRS